MGKEVAGSSPAVGPTDRSGLDLDQPQDDLGVALAGAAQGREPLEHGQISRSPFSFSFGS